MTRKMKYRERRRKNCIERELELEREELNPIERGLMGSIPTFTICITYMSLYWSLYVDAAKVNDVYRDTDGLENPFDACHLAPTQIGEKQSNESTNWSLVITFNAIVYTVLSATNCCVFLSRTTLGKTGMCCNFIFQIA